MPSKMLLLVDYEDLKLMSLLPIAMQNPTKHNIINIGYRNNGFPIHLNTSSYIKNNNKNQNGFGMFYRKSYF